MIFVMWLIYHVLWDSKNKKPDSLELPGLLLFKGEIYSTLTFSFSSLLISEVAIFKASKSISSSSS